MKVLLVAPATNLDVIPEIRTISSQHTTFLLNGTVTAEDVYDAVSSQEFDIIHFASHQAANESTLDRIQLSNNDYLDLPSISRVVKLGKAKLVILSICQGSRIAVYLINQKIPNVLFATTAIEDHIAWQLMSAFYSVLKRYEIEGKQIDYHEIFKSVDSGDGQYGMMVSIDLYKNVLNDIRTSIAQIDNRVTQLDKHIVKQSQYMTMTKILLLLWIIQIAANIYTLLR